MWWLAALATLSGLVALGGRLYFEDVKRNRRLVEQWQAVFAEQGATELEGTADWVDARLTARLGRMEMRLTLSPREGLLAEMEFPGPPGFAAVSLRRETHRPWGASEIQTGDESFDRTFFIEEPASLVTALLDARTRALLLEANLEGEIEIRGGVIQAKPIDHALPHLPSLLFGVGRRLTLNEGIARRLADNARQDPLPGVRLRNLLLLVREHREDAGTAEALGAACGDPDPQVRLRAALELGVEGRETLVALAEGQDGDTWSAQAVATLGRQLPVERTTAILQQSLRRSCFETARACVESLGRWRGAAVDELAKVLERERDDLAAAAALALGETGDEAAEPPLFRALAHGALEVRTAAATALGRVGTTAAVLPLQEAAEEDRGLRRAARQSIAEIQSRLQGATPGQLSLADAEAGQLSLAPAEAGQLSLAPPRQRA